MRYYLAWVHRFTGERGQSFNPLTYSAAMALLQHAREHLPDRIVWVTQFPVSPASRCS